MLAAHRLRGSSRIENLNRVGKMKINKALIGAAVLSAIVTLCAAPASAVVSAPMLSFNSFGHGGTSNPGFCVSGPDTYDCGPTTSRWLSAPFTPSISGPLNHLDLAVGQNSGTQGVIVTLVADNAGSPGAIAPVLETWVVPKLSACCTSTIKLKLTSKLHPQLNLGLYYWVIVAPLGYDTLAGWRLSPTNTGTGQSSLDGGQNWTLTFPFPAFDVFVQ